MPPDKSKIRSRKARLPQGAPVADKASNDPRPFNLKTIEHLVALMSQNDLSEIDLREGDLRIRVQRGPRGTPVVTGAVAASPAPVAAPASPTAAPAKPEKKLVEIKSPTPGTFYAKSNPDTEPYVRAGARVQANTVVCLIEAMKLFTEIQAECAGVIIEILVENGQPVEYGQVLFRVDPAG
jgi:acetyl-CoA carboxylase biotin carboxyl carrier protein